MKRLILAGVALGAILTPAFAADPPAPLEPVIVTGWDGYYLGVQGGYAWATIDDDYNYGGLPDYDIEGGFGGLYYGRNWQSGNLVYGLDGSIAFADIDGGGFDGDDAAGYFVSIKGFSASRARIGYAFDNVLIFGAAGLSVARLEADNTSSVDKDWAFGFTAGAGIEAKLAENWSARLEYLYINYFNAEAEFGGSQVIDLDIDTHVVRGGIAYHF